MTCDANRQRALRLIRLRLHREPRPADRLDELGYRTLAGLLYDLETAFEIGLEVDEALPDGTVGGLLELVLLRARGERIDRPGPAEACRLYDFAAERARRARGLRLVEVA